MFSVSNSQITIEHNSIQLIVVSYLMSCSLLTITLKHDLNDLNNAIVGIEYNSIQYFIVS